MFSENQIAVLLNEWLTRYTLNPEQFEHEFRTVMLHAAERSMGREQSYGHDAAAYLVQLSTEIKLPQV